MRPTPWIILLCACGGAAPTPESALDYDGAEESVETDNVAEMAAQMAVPLPSQPSGHSLQASNHHPIIEPDQASALPVPSQQRLRLIYTARLGLLVEHGQRSATLDRLLATTLQQGGYLSSRDENRFVVRVPSERFHEIFAIFEQHGEVSERNVEVQDVSEEYHDLEVRIESLTALLARMRGLLERATTLDEMLRIEGELGRVVSEIDQARGRLRFLGSQAAWSTISLTVREMTPPPPNEEPPAVAPARAARLPIDWLNETGLSGLLNLEN